MPHFFDRNGETWSGYSWQNGQVIKVIIISYIPYYINNRIINTYINFPCSELKPPRFPFSPFPRFSAEKPIFPAERAYDNERVYYNNVRAQVGFQYLYSRNCI